MTQTRWVATTTTKSGGSRSGSMFWSVCRKSCRPRSASIALCAATSANKFRGAEHKRRSTFLQANTFNSQPAKRLTVSKLLPQPRLQMPKRGRSMSKSPSSRQQSPAGPCGHLLTDGSLSEQSLAVLKCFQVDDESLVKIKTMISRELELGLRDEDSATIKMLITYVRELSRGDESGLYLALDLGGTHFRVLLVNLNGDTPDKPPKVITVVHDIPAELLVTQNGYELFDYIALKLLEFVQQYKLKRKRISLGFTFSFPCKQYGLTQSILVKWCKGFNVGGVIGTDVVKQLKDALKRQLAGLVEAYIDVVAVINDTTGTLVACANKHRECRVGLIVGTGFNACYMERLDQCEKWPANYTSPKQVIINCEWGAMGDNKERRELDKFRNEFDAQIDSASVNPSSQTYEKMIGGMYLGELLRLALLKLYESKQLFQGSSCRRCESSTVSSSPKSPAAAAAAAGQQKSASAGKQASSSTGGGGGQAPRPTQKQPQHKLNVKDVLNGKHLSMLGRDELSGSFEETVKVLRELNISNYSQQDLCVTVKLAEAIVTRAANLVASGIASLLERMRRPFSVIGYDGSVIKNHPYFLTRLVEKTAQLSAKEYKFEFVSASDGSGIGAAIVAAALHKERRPMYVVKPGKLYEMHFAKAQLSKSSFDQSTSARKDASGRQNNGGAAK